MRTGPRKPRVFSSASLGTIAAFEGALQEAESLHRQCLVLRRERQQRREIVESIAGLAGVAAALAAQEETTAKSERRLREVSPRALLAARLCGAVSALRPIVPSSLSPFQRAVWDEIVATARVVLGEAAFAAAWAEGQAMSLEEAVTYALNRE